MTANRLMGGIRGEDKVMGRGSPMKYVANPMDHYDRNDS